MTLAIKRIHNLPPQLSYVSTLPDVTQNLFCLCLNSVLSGSERAGCVARSQWVLEVTSLCLYTCTQPCLPLVNGFVDDALRNTVASVNASARQCRISVFV